MTEKSKQFPYRSLGVRLKKVRQKLQETLAEVSGAVEIDMDTLRDIEYGLSRPSEDVLLLLVSHFALGEDDAANLWSLAGYDTAEADQVDAKNVFILPFDIRIVYADMAHVNANDYGLVINFMQSGGPGSQPLAISRVGMSKEHARSVIELLQDALDHATPPKKTKMLPRTSTKADEQPKQ